ncbi:MAG: hypothetical protein QNJ91_06220 [Gammaproteobacteria bacterium]|nr:hypothetical protein [Gammaproteobacteria bacterium]
MRTSRALDKAFRSALHALGIAALSGGVMAAGAPNNYFEVTVRPGTSAICTSDPCTVYFETPAGSGTHTILQNGSIKAGVATGGERVLLGVFSNESFVYHVEGTDLPAAYLTVVGSP